MAGSPSRSAGGQERRPSQLCSPASRQSCRGVLRCGRSSLARTCVALCPRHAVCVCECVRECEQVRCVSLNIAESLARTRRRSVYSFFSKSFRKF